MSRESRLNGVLEARAEALERIVDERAESELRALPAKVQKVLRPELEAFRQGGAAEQPARRAAVEFCLTPYADADAVLDLLEAYATRPSD